VTATLVALGDLRPGDLALDVGCGDGTESISLARLGIPTVGIDSGSVAKARERAEKAGVAPMTTFLRASALSLSRTFEPATFDAVIDVLLYNNLALREESRYVEEVARVLRPGGLYVGQWRVGPHREHVPREELADHLPPAFTRLFDAALPVHTRIPARRQSARGPDHAAVGIVVGWKRAP
jgi:ubiquinone/menaquinone biosynthesis C-methylase UbiE